jgi:eukaryotic-like serine/threonine-protein kinase
VVRPKVTSAPAFRIGDVIAGKYRIDKILGAGGMGVVVAARHLTLDDVVAIKFLSAELANDAHAVSRFDREARAAAKIKSEYVVRVFDVDRLPNGSPYMVMEYLRGSDLSTLMEGGKPLSEERAITFVLQACVGLHEAHSAGIIHRDIKLSNLFCVERPTGDFTIKVFDFGISKLTLTSDSLKAVITGTGAAVGSPAYMSPEQMRSSADVDPRTDIWSLGVVLYELVTGKLPFDGTSYPELCLKIAGDPPTTPRQYRPTLSPRLEAIILKCLEKDREQRFASVAALADALLPLVPAAAYIGERIRAVAPHTQTVRLVLPGPVQTSTLPLAPAAPEAPSHGKHTVTDATWSHPELRGEARKSAIKLWIGLASGMALLVTFLGIWWLRPTPEPVAPAASSSLPGPAAVSAPLPPPAVTTPPAASSSPPEVAPDERLTPTPVGASTTKSPVLVLPPQASSKPLPAGTSSPRPSRSNSSVWNQRD